MEHLLIGYYPKTLAEILGIKVDTARKILRGANPLTEKHKLLLARGRVHPDNYLIDLVERYNTPNLTDAQIGEAVRLYALGNGSNIEDVAIVIAKINTRI